MAVVYSVQAQSRPGETFALMEFEVAPGVHRSCLSSCPDFYVTDLFFVSLKSFPFGDPR